MYLKIKLAQLDIDKYLALACLDIAMNETLGPEGLVPSSLVFGEFPQLKITSDLSQ